MSSARSIIEELNGLVIQNPRCLHDPTP